MGLKNWLTYGRPITTDTQMASLWLEILYIHVSRGVSCIGSCNRTLYKKQWR